MSKRMNKWMNAWKNKWMNSNVTKDKPTIPYHTKFAHHHTSCHTSNWDYFHNHHHIYTPEKIMSKFRKNKKEAWKLLWVGPEIMELLHSLISSVKNHSSFRSYNCHSTFWQPFLKYMSVYIPKMFGFASWDYYKIRRNTWIVLMFHSILSPPTSQHSLTNVNSGNGSSST